MMQPTLNTYEAEVLPGLESFAATALDRIEGVRVLESSSGKVPFEYGGDPARLADLRTVGAVYRVLTFPVPRPKALLGHQHFSALTAAARQIAATSESFSTLSLDAAGSDSTVMQRISADLAQALSLTPADERGDLHIRIRPARDRGWQALLRLTPRPLATRSWRLHNLPGALNAAVAAAMASLTQPRQSDHVLNLFCGSATLMIERAALFGGYERLSGIDSNQEVLGLAEDHLRAAAIAQTELVCADAVALPFPVDSFDVLLADLPFGQLMGSHAVNRSLYPAALHEAARVARPGTRFALITHEKRLVSEVLGAQSHWSVEQRIPINLNGLHPDIILLRRET
jgi:tRNA (guanine6-N2)-methyltransferase